jgi:hypothetical protein
LLTGWGLAQFVPSMPNDNVAGEFFGRLDIVKKGTYTLCTISDDGCARPARRQALRCV